MSPTMVLSNNAELALASYATLLAGNTSLDTNRDALILAGMTVKQTDEFARRYPIVVLSTFHDPASDFDVNVFKDVNGELSIALRGTQESHDLLVTDADIASTGVGFDQVVAMHNWWLRVSTASGQVAQFQYTGGQLPPSSPVAATGELFGALAADPDHKVNVVGHSLGGHLAMAFNTLFPVVTSQVVTFNAPGFWNSRSENQAFFAALGGSIPTEANSANVTNVIANETSVGHAPFSAVAGLRTRPGVDVNIPIENQWQSDEPQPELAKNHSIRPLADSLAVLNVLTQLAPSLSTTDYRTILGQAASGTSASYEKIVDVLERLFGINQASLTIGNNNRDALYQAIYGLQSNTTNPLFSATAGQLRIIPTGTSASSLSNLAVNGDVDAMAYRYALRELNPFVVLGPSLYTSSTAALEDLTAEYLTDRAAMLAWKNQDYIADGQGVIAGDTIETYKYTDKTLKNTLGNDLTFTVRGRQISSVSNPVMVTFGSEASETLTGGNVALGDHLYGGGGGDILGGQGGNDYLEGDAGDDTLTGGAGDDILAGGTGSDTYVYDEGDGFDRITDADGAGRILYKGRELTGGSKTAEGDYADTSGVEFTVLDDGTGSQSLLIGGDLYIENFVDGTLGIHLGGEVSAPEPPDSSPVHVYADDYRPEDFAPNGSDPYRFIRNLYGSGGDDLFSTTGRFNIFGRSGNDVAIFDGDDTYDVSIDMGAGDDLIDLSASVGRNDVNGFAPIVGGGGNDFITGSAGADSIAGDNFLAISADVYYGGAGQSAGFFYVDSFRFNSNSGNGYVPPGHGAFNFVGGGEFEVTTFEDIGESILIPEGAAIAGTLEEALLFVIGSSGTFDDFIDAGDGNDSVVGGSGSDEIYGGSGNDSLVGDYGSAAFGAPNYFTLDDHFGSLAALFGRPGDDHIDGGDGDDVINDTYGGNDILIGGEGNDTIVSREAFWTPADGDGAHNVIRGGAGNDIITVENNTGGFDVVDGGDGDDLVTVSASHFVIDEDHDGVAESVGLVSGRAVVFGGNGNDVLNVTADDAFVDGGAGDDEYTLSNGSFVLFDSAGDDTLHAFLDDLSLVDEFLEGFPVLDPADAAELDASDEQYDSVVVQEGNDLVSTTRSVVDGEEVYFRQVRFSDWFTGAGNRIEHVGASGGFEEVILSSVQFETWGGLHYGGGGADALVEATDFSDRAIGRAGNDLISTGAGADRLYGGIGDDELHGGAGDDIYYYAAGDGHDVVYDTSGFDEIRVGPGLSVTDVAASESESGIVLTIGVGRIDIAGGSRSNPVIERLGFADGSIVMMTTLLEVEEINNAPTGLSLSSNAVAENAPGAPIGALSTTDEDAGDTFTYSILSGGDGSQFAIVGDELRVGSVGLNFEASATRTLAVRTTDAAGAYFDRSFSINVTGVAESNTAPVVSATDTTVILDQTVAALSLFSVFDADGDTPAQNDFWDSTAGTNPAPVVSAATQGVLRNEVAAAGSLLSVTDGGMLRAGVGPDTLNGDPDTPVAEGGAGNDTLNAADINSLFSGGDGGDTLNGGAGDDLLAGGAGDDTTATGNGRNVIAFNAGGEADSISSDAGASNTLSLGGGVKYEGLSLSKDGEDLVLNTGGDDSIRLKNWYNGKDTVQDLQLILDATDDFDANSADPLYSRRVQSFDFRGLVSQFDPALAASPGLSSWAVTNALLQFHLSGADNLALGGDLAYWYGRNGGFTGIGLAAAQAAIGAPGFGTDAQTLQPFSGLQEGLVKLA